LGGLLRFMPTDEAAGGGAQKTVVAYVMAREAADQSAFETPARMRRP
jgi:hypothetical protein